MLTQLKFKADFRCFKKDDTFEFRPGINLFVGDQGSGKSTLLALVRALAVKNVLTGLNGEDAAKVISLTTDKTGSRVLSFDFEKDNPRMAHSFEMPNMSAELIVRSRFVSHGQLVNSILDNIEGLKNEKSHHAILMDEPDTGLSPRSARAFAGSLESLAKHHQILAAVHNPLVIESVPEVLSLEHRRWMKSNEFMEAMKTPRKETKDGSDKA